MNKKISVIIAITVLLLGACGPVNPAPSATPDEQALATIVAQTVEAQLTQIAHNNVTPTPAEATLTPTATAVAPPLLPSVTPAGTGSENVEPCYSANFISDVSIPDGTLVKPGQLFTKTWLVRNSGTCPWDNTFSLVFDRGDSMGTTYSFPMPNVAPGQSAQVSIALVAPLTEGVTRGFWRIRTPYGGTFGFGQYSKSIYVEVNVSSTSVPAVSSITYSIDRQPKTGCVVGAKHIIYATIRSNSPITVEYFWRLTDDVVIDTPVKTLVFSSAEEKTIRFEWEYQESDISHQLSASVFIKSPNNQFFQGPRFKWDCR